MNPGPGLRERKKAKTRAVIQRHALRLFAKHGYDNTSVSQIAAAAEVSESTFFRYFRTKEEVVLWDDLDAPLFEALRAAPPDAGPVRAVRHAFRGAFGQLSAAERDRLRQRVQVMLSAAPLRGQLVDQIAGPMRLLAEAVADRAGVSKTESRAVAGAIIGVGLAAMFAAAEDPKVDLIELLDEMLEALDRQFQQLATG